MPAKGNIRSFIKEAVRRIVPDSEVILFGSRARGDGDPDSDWDILILVAGNLNRRIEEKIRDAIYDIELDLETPISVFIYTKENWLSKQSITPFYENVNREGVFL